MIKTMKTLVFGSEYHVLITVIGKYYSMLVDGHLAIRKIEN